MGGFHVDVPFNMQFGNYLILGNMGSFVLLKLIIEELTTY